MSYDVIPLSIVFYQKNVQNFVLLSCWQNVLLILMVSGASTLPAWWGFVRFLFVSTSEDCVQTEMTKTSSLRVQHLEAQT